jgi:late competence protein required for DNA uptake (superfamily II DNA/RNA helicase)
MGFIAAPLHGESSKDDRKEIIGRLRDGRLNLVVTTELAARGLVRVYVYIFIFGFIYYYVYVYVDIQ